MKHNSDKKKKFSLPTHLSYWENQVPEEEFNRWCGNPFSPFKMIIRQIIHAHGYESVLDVGAGTDSMARGFQDDAVNFKRKIATYVATDITPKYVTDLQKKGIEAYRCSVESMPFEDNQFECVLCLDVLNHQLSYEEQIKELLRVSKDQVIITFFKCFEELIGETFPGTNQPLPGSTHAAGAKLEKTELGTLEHRITEGSDTVCVYHYFNRSKLLNFLESLKVDFSIKYTPDNVVILFLKKNSFPKIQLTEQ
mgnify:CR=1 FL=1